MSTQTIEQPEKVGHSSELLHVCAIFEHRYASGPPCTSECDSLCGAIPEGVTVILDEPTPDCCVVCTEMALRDDPHWRQP